MAETLMNFINFGNLLLGSVAFFLLFQRTFRRRREYPYEVYLLLVVVEAFVIALLATSFELLSLPVNGWLVLLSGLIAGAKIALLWVLWATRHALYRTGVRHEGPGHNGDETNVDKDVEA